MHGCRARFRWVINHVTWYDDDPDPRVLQSAYAVTVLLPLVVLAVRGDRVGLVSWPALAFLLTAAAAGAVIARPGLADLRWARVTIPVLDIVAVGLLTTDPRLADTALIVLFAALWAGLDLGLPGAALAMGSTIVFVTVPGALAGGSTIERTLLVPVLAGMVPAAITYGVRRAQRAQERAEAHRAELTDALKVIENSRRNTEAIFTAVNMGLGLLDPEGGPVLINQRLGRMANLAFPAGIDSLDDGWIFDESGSVRLRYEDTPIYRARCGEEFDDLRVWIGEDPERRRAISMSARRVEDADGALTAAAVSFADVTDFMRALEVKDEFIALVSHELRTPLTSIYGYVDVLREDDSLPDRARSQLEVVFRNAERLDRLVDDLLDEVQHASGQIRLEVSEVDLAAVVRDCLTAAFPTAAEADVELGWDLPEALVVYGDRQRLAQVVDNLLSNALKYTPAGGQAEVVLTTDHAGESRWAVLRIRDAGIGIATGDQEQLFTRFYRTREATDRAIQGVGLGLSITKAIVQRHGGRIGVESQIGVGSVFDVQLPLPHAQEAA